MSTKIPLTIQFPMIGQKKGLEIIYVNIKSLYKTKDELFNLTNGYDIICIGETWLSDKISDNMLYHLAYKIFRQDRQETDQYGNILKKRGGGLLIYVCDKLFSYCTVINDCMSCTNSLEQLWINIKYLNMRQQAICSCYRPPGGSPTLCIHS